MQKYILADPNIMGLNDHLKTLVLGQLGCHYGINCDACSTENIFGYRYKCAVCDDYDLCSKCFEDRKEGENHKASHPLLVVRSPLLPALANLLSLGMPKLQEKLMENDVTHDSDCKSCGDGRPIKGLLFICDDCRGCRLCYTCYKSKRAVDNHNGNHCLIVCVAPQEFLIRRAKIGLKKELGHGSFGQVFLCDINDQTAAIKFCKTRGLTNLSGYERHCLENEIEIYQEFFCDYIVEIKGYGFGDNDTLFMVLEYLSSGNLLEHIRSSKYATVSKRRRFMYCENIIRALFRMHKKEIIHKDLKLDNFFLTDHQTLKLGDLGIAFDPKTTAAVLKGVSQQLYYPTDSPNIFHPSHDIYALGLIINEIMTGEQNTALTQNDCKDQKKVPYFGALISACISASGRDRPTTECVKKYILQFCQHLEDHIKLSKIDYEKEPLAKRNEVFNKAYQTFVNKVRFVNETDENYRDQRLAGSFLTFPVFENSDVRIILLNNVRN